MKVYANQLDGQLAQMQPVPIYLISGDEPMLIDEARDAICTMGKQAGYTTLQRHDYTAKFDWVHLQQDASNLSLFGDRYLIELVCSAAKFERDFAKQVKAWIESWQGDALLIIRTPKLTSAQQKSAWCQAIESAGLHCQVYPLQGQRLADWLTQRSQSLGLKLERQAMALIAEQTEGNLLAAKQVLTKLQLLHNDTPVTLADTQAVMTDMARYHVFDLSNAMLLGNVKKVVRILEHFQAVDADRIALLWTVLREVRRLIELQHHILQGMSVAQALKDEWDFKKPLYQKALSRLTPRATQAVLRQLAAADGMLKGASSQDGWLTLTRAILCVSGAPLRLSEGLV